LKYLQKYQIEAVGPAALQASLRPGDVLLVEGTSRISRPAGLTAGD